MTKWIHAHRGPIEGDIVSEAAGFVDIRTRGGEDLTLRANLLTEVTEVPAPEAAAHARALTAAAADGVTIAPRSELGRPRHEEGLYALTKLARDLPEGPALDMVRDVIRRPWRAALATVLIAAQLGSRTNWSGADELQGISEVLDGAGLPLGNPALYRAIADEFGIEHDDEEEFEDEG